MTPKQFVKLSLKKEGDIISYRHPLGIIIHQIVGDARWSDHQGD